MVPDVSAGGPDTTRQNGYLSDKKTTFYQKAHYNNQSVRCHFGCHLGFLIYRASYPTLRPVVPRPKPRQERVRFGSGLASPVGVKVHKIYIWSSEVRCYNPVLRSGLTNRVGV